MPSIVNGLFSGRSGLASHGIAIAVVGDNIANASTVGFKSSRAEFADLISSGQPAGKAVGAGSTVSAINVVFDQGTLEFSGRSLDLAVEGNGLFIVADGDQRFYTRAGNFKVNADGILVNQKGLAVLGFPVGGTGDLQEISVNNVSQDNVTTTEVEVSGNVDASATAILSTDIPTVSNAGTTTSTTTYAELNSVAQFTTVVNVFDSLGAKHAISFFFYHTGTNEYTVNGYINSEDVDPSGSATGLPRLVGTATMDFDGDGSRTTPPTAGSPDISASIPWNNGSNTSPIDINFDPFTQFSSASGILSITQDGQGIGAISSLSIEKNGEISAILDNGQTAVIATLGLANFANPEALARVGGTLLQQSPQSGEPVTGKPESGTFGAVNSGSLELSTVDIASEFVRLITLQRGFQANSRIITTINQLLNEIIQLA